MVQAHLRAAREEITRLGLRMHEGVPPINCPYMYPGEAFGDGQVAAAKSSALSGEVPHKFVGRKSRGVQSLWGCAITRFWGEP